VTTYPKIETLFDRDDTFRVDTTRLRRPVYATIRTWVVTEKIDGTNMRLIFDRTAGSVLFDVRGKTDNASIPPALLRHCVDLATRLVPDVTETMDQHSLNRLILHGEGYGAKIQGGGKYRPDQGFILFDVQAGDVFLSDDQVTKTGAVLDIPRVPVLGEKTLDEIVSLVRAGFPSWTTFTSDPDFPAEGVVARTVEPLYDNRGERLIIKLKTKDFRGGKR